MKITAIKQQVKVHTRYSIFIDEKYAFSLSEGELISSGIHTGQEITPQELVRYKELSATDKLYGLALRLISRRPRSERELHDYLYRKGLDEGGIDALILRLTKNGLVDDRDFALRWVESRRLLKQVSQRRLKLELRQKGIASDVIQFVIEADTTSDAVTLTELIAQKRRLSRYQDELKLMQFLARQGFTYEDIKRALQED